MWRHRSKPTKPARIARQAQGGGRRAEADAEVQRALTVFRSLGATVYVNEAETLFAASA